MGYDEKYKGKTIKGAVFPDKRVNRNRKIHLNIEILNEYIPVLNKVMRDVPYGFRLLTTVMAFKEGFYKKTSRRKYSSRSYRTKNPGNIGNTDNGLNRSVKTLEEGVLAQKNYILKIVNGKHRAYPMGKVKVIRPYFSKEIARNSKRYGMSPWLPGYIFTFDGSLEQFVKIYATGARAGNSYLSIIISFFKSKGIIITPKSKIQDIIKIKA